MKTLYKALLWLMVTAVPLVIAACYGPMYRYTKSGRIIDATNQKALQNIKVTCLRDGKPLGFAVSTSEGEFWLDNMACDSLKFEDESGKHNPRTVSSTKDFEQFDIELD